MLAVESGSDKCQNCFVGHGHGVGKKMVDEHGANVCFHEDYWPVVDVGSDGGGSVWADARQFLEQRGILRRLAAMFGNDILGGLPQKLGPAIVAKPIPSYQHSAQRCHRQSLHIWK